MRLLIVGPQGAGKGTQAELLTKAVGIPHVSTGDLFRANISGNTPLGQKVKAIMDAGQLVPDEVTQDMLVDRLAQPDAEVGFLLDGFPRNISQASWLEGVLAERGTPIKCVLLVDAPDEVLRERMTARGRSDDTPESIDRRLAIYHAETSPLIEFYGEKVARIDGVGEIHEVQERIRKAIDALD
ncbi:adenylate kinase [Nakamurella sp. YIM 132087]|uniref:Adenylate kinase n=1 Tax=Nakamurella alba TaxID=2665158 RepID=A0A7K1FJZ1_9ACTN|nr:adenylate kinase [Nakamurella alba]MTD14390.1 adenylate kinase [Nakamurella alba]